MLDEPLEGFLGVALDLREVDRVRLRVVLVADLELVHPEGADHALNVLFIIEN